MRASAGSGPGGETWWPHREAKTVLDWQSTEVSDLGYVFEPCDRGQPA